MEGRSLKVTSTPLKNEGYADQLEDNRAAKSVEKKKVFKLF